MSIYTIPVLQADGSESTLEPYRGRVLLIVNVASKCGFTPQYRGLEELHRKYRDAGLTVLGFPCNQFLFQEPGADGAIQEFCSREYAVTFPVFAKLRVNGSQTHPLYRWLRTQKRGLLGTSRIKWNFTKFLLNRAGDVVGRFGPLTKPASLESRIQQLLAEPAVIPQ